MPVTDFTIDEHQRTITILAEFRVTAERLWSAFCDARQIERWWAPPGYSARFFRHDCFPGGVSKYEIYDEDHGVHSGYWQWQSVTGQHSFTVTDGFAGEDGAPIDDLPTTVMRSQIDTIQGGSRLTTVFSFHSAESFDTTIEMGGAEGTRAAISQLDEMLGLLEPYAVEFDTTVQRISAHQLRISRLLKGPIDEVWDAHTQPEGLSVWKTGQDGWSMPVCEFSAEPGAKYHMEWKNELGGQGFGVMGEVVELVTERRLVLTEQFIGEEAAESLHEYTFVTFDDTTLVTTVITYPRELKLQEGPDRSMAVGFEEAYDRLDRLLIAT